MIGIKLGKTPGKREMLFCTYFSLLRNGREAAARAGWRSAPEEAAQRLLGREDIRQEIAALDAKRKNGLEEVAAGYKRLAFGSVADALKLLLAETVPTDEELERLDFFNVSDIKRPKGGGLEIKFFDRLKALERLAEIGEITSAGTAATFIDALERGALAIGGSDENGTA